MTRELETLRLVRGSISELEPEQRERVNQCTRTIRELLASHPDGEALMALALIGAEFDARA